MTDHEGSHGPHPVAVSVSVSSGSDVRLKSDDPVKFGLDVKQQALVPVTAMGIVIEAEADEEAI